MIATPLCWCIAEVAYAVEMGRGGNPMIRPSNFFLLSCHIFVMLSFVLDAFLNVCLFHSLHLRALLTTRFLFRIYMHPSDSAPGHCTFPPMTKQTEIIVSLYFCLQN